MPRSLRYAVAASIALSAAAFADETVIWLPVPEPPGFYSNPLGGMSWSPSGDRIAYTWWEYIPPQYHYLELRIVHWDATYETCPIQYGSGHAAWSPHENLLAVANGRL